MQPHTTPLTPYKKIIAVSDSLTNEFPDNYLALLGQMLQTTTIANAYGGWSTHSYFRERFKDIAFQNIQPDADLFLLLLGSNNLFEDGGGSQKSIDEAVQGVEKIANHLLTIAPRARFLLVAPPIVVLKNNKVEEPKPPRRIDDHSPEMLRRLAAAYEALARQKGWLFANLQPVLSEDDFYDACHPNAEGNRKIAAALAPVLRSPHASRC